MPEFAPVTTAHTSPTPSGASGGRSAKSGVSGRSREHWRARVARRPCLCGHPRDCGSSPPLQAESAAVVSDDTHAALATAYLPSSTGAGSSATPRRPWRRLPPRRGRSRALVPRARFVRAPRSATRASPGAVAAVRARPRAGRAAPVGRPRTQCDGLAARRGGAAPLSELRLRARGVARTRSQRRSAFAQRKVLFCPTDIAGI